MILHCRRREAVLSRSDRPHPRIVSYLQRAGLYGLYCLRFIQLDWALIIAFVERWRPETHTFHLPFGEMTITLQDMEVMLGLPVDGRPVIRSMDLKWPDVCGELLGVIPPSDKIDGCRLSMTWLSEQFGVLPDNADEVIVQRYARAYILEMLGGSVFADTSGDKVHLIWLLFLEDFDTAGEYSWGSAALAWLYRQLCNAAKANTKDIGGALILVQLWAWSRFPHMTPEIVSIQPIEYGVDAAGQPLPQGPYGIRWCNAKCQKNVSTHVLLNYRSALVLQHPNERCTAPDRVLRQFGMQQFIPRPINTDVTLHAVTLRRRADWTKKWESHVDTWNNRLEHVITSDPVSHPMPYNDEYMVWYRRITRRYICKRSASFDALMFPSDHPASKEAYRGLKIAQSLNRLSPRESTHPVAPDIAEPSSSTHPISSPPTQSTHPVTPHPTHLVTPHPAQSTHPVTPHPTHPVTPHPAQSTHSVIPHPTHPVTPHPAQSTHSVTSHPTHPVTPYPAQSTHPVTPIPLTQSLLIPHSSPTQSPHHPAQSTHSVTPHPTHPVTPSSRTVHPPSYPIHPMHPVTPHPAQSTHSVTPHPTHPVTPYPTYLVTPHPTQSTHSVTLHPTHPITPHPAQSTHSVIPHPTHPVTTHPTQSTHPVTPYPTESTHPVTPHIEETPYRFHPDIFTSSLTHTHHRTTGTGTGAFGTRRWA
uniref:Aminotransferase-like plant mobile domain-containing protein n=1 Tax=Fagus sylvatica TaxID=28930 RepID=A0A2N9GCH7_FAGSY